MDASYLDKLNPQQRAAATAPADQPVLIIAGAGTGKTNTLAHRVAHLIHLGVDPSRLLLLTFTRRAAAEMARRADGILKSAALSKAGGDLGRRIWSGTFHAMANRLLRLHADALGLSEAFTVIDRSDAEDLINIVRSELELDRQDVRFPRKGTCLSIYSRCVNAAEEVEAALKSHFPWCQDFPGQLRGLFAAYTRRKHEQNTLDYDDLLLYWRHAMDEPSVAAEISGRFDAVLVDEYQDTNELQARILRALCPAGRGLTVVGDDAQSIYSFRAASVRNILEFPAQFPGALVQKLEHNYRSVQPILEATNAVIGLCPNRFHKNLFSERASSQKPALVTVMDEDQQCDYVIRRILGHVEAGIPLRKQAVLFRAAHHSDALEVELARRNIPFVKYGGLKFLEAAHVKDALSYLRAAENPRDVTCVYRIVQLLDGFGPAHTRRLVDFLASAGHDLRRLADFAPPAAATGQWPDFCALMADLRTGAAALPDQVAMVRRFYGPILERRYDQGPIRARDLEQLQQISSNFHSRSQLLADLTLDPPSGTQDLAGPPLFEEDYLILSTIHSAKGCEWDAVYVIHCADGNIPSDMATASDAEIEEERRLFYVALTRARDFLDVVFPLKYYQKKHRMGDRHTYAQLTRFLPDSILNLFDKVSLTARPAAQIAPGLARAQSSIRAKIAGMWGA